MDLSSAQDVALAGFSHEIHSWMSRTKNYLDDELGEASSGSCVDCSAQVVPAARYPAALKFESPPNIPRNAIMNTIIALVPGFTTA